VTALEAMDEVNGYLDDGNIAGAQAAVVAIEQEQTVLPSSVFGRVLREALKTDSILPFYSEFCKRVFSADAYNDIVATTLVSMLGDESAVRRTISPAHSAK